MTRIVRDSVEMLARLLEFFPLKIKKSHVNYLQCCGEIL